MTRPELASVVINNFNYGRYLGSAIASALEQTYSHTEVIVVDDGSTDDSRAVIASFGDRIKPVLQDNGGQASALNAGFRASRGAVIVFLDADDTMLPTAVASAVHACRAAEVVKVHWPLWTVNEHGVRTGRMTPQGILPDGDLRDALARDGPLCTQSPPTSGNAWTRLVLERLMPIPAEYKLCADEYLYALAPAFGIVKRLPEPQGTYRRHAHNGYLGKPLEEKVAFGRCVQEMQCDLLATHLRSLGFEVAPETSERWKSKQWFCRLADALAAIRAAIPQQSVLILADDDQWGVAKTLAGRRCFPFLERNGQYWGPPGDDTAALDELARLRNLGAEFFVLAWPAFWWLEFYRVFFAKLRTKHPCVIESGAVVAFDLRREFPAPPSV